MPASVKDRLKRLSFGTPTVPTRVPKLNFWYSIAMPQHCEL